jgi:hypothetical protein
VLEGLGSLDQAFILNQLVSYAEKKKLSGILIVETKFRPSP